MEVTCDLIRERIDRRLAPFPEQVFLFVQFARTVFPCYDGGGHSSAEKVVADGSPAETREGFSFGRFSGMMGMDLLPCWKPSSKKSDWLASVLRRAILLPCLYNGGRGQYGNVICYIAKRLARVPPSASLFLCVEESRPCYQHEPHRPKFERGSRVNSPASSVHKRVRVAFSFFVENN